MTRCAGREKDCRILREPFLDQSKSLPAQIFIQKGVRVPGTVQPFVLKGVQIPGGVQPSPGVPKPSAQPSDSQKSAEIKPKSGSIRDVFLVLRRGAGSGFVPDEAGFPTRVRQTETTQISGDGYRANEAALAPQNPALLAVGIRHGYDQLLCTGVLLGPRHVLTAGHCGCSNPSTYEVILGDDAHPPNVGIKLGQSPILFDPRSCPPTSTPVFGKDLALLILDNAFSCAQAARVQIDAAAAGTVSKSQPPTAVVVADCEPPARQAPADGNRTTFGYPGELFGKLQPPLTVGQKLLAVGYGYTDEVHLGRRAAGPIPIRSVACTERALERFCQPFAEMILADKQGPGIEADTCKGDSGGPVFLTDNGIYKLIAITSRAGPGAQSDTVAHCGGGGIYTIVGRQSVLDWLRANGVPDAQLVQLARQAGN